jgi:hypothetical protein
MDLKTMCLRQFIRPEPSPFRKHGWGWCARQFDDGRIIYCKKHEHNSHCEGYYPITVLEIEIKD